MRLGEPRDGGTADEVLQVAGVRIQLGRRAGDRQVADLARAPRCTAVDAAALVDRQAEALAHPEQREAARVAPGAVGAFGEGGQVHVVVDADGETERIAEAAADALLGPVGKRLDVGQLVGARVEGALDADADRADALGRDSGGLARGVDREPHIHFGGAAGERGDRDRAFVAGGVHDRRADHLRVDVDRDGEHPVGADGVTGGVRAPASGDLADDVDETGRLEARHHLRGGRLRQAGELADAVPGEDAVFEQQRQRSAVVGLAQPPGGAPDLSGHPHPFVGTMLSRECIRKVSL